MFPRPPRIMPRNSPPKSAKRSSSSSTKFCTGASNFRSPTSFYIWICPLPRPSTICAAKRKISLKRAWDTSGALPKCIASSRNKRTGAPSPASRTARCVRPKRFTNWFGKRYNRFVEAKKAIRQAVSKALQQSGITIHPEDVPLEFPAELSHGDYATGVALKEAKNADINPRDLSQKLVEAMGHI